MASEKINKIKFKIDKIKSKRKEKEIYKNVRKVSAR